MALYMTGAWVFQFESPSSLQSDGLGKQVEATKFTEVGFHGRDVDQIIRDLVDNAIILTKQRMRKRMQKKIARAVEDKIIDALCGPQCEERTKVRGNQALNEIIRHSAFSSRCYLVGDWHQRPLFAQETFREQYRRGNLEDRKVTIDVPTRAPSVPTVDLGGFQQARQSTGARHTVLQN